MFGFKLENSPSAIIAENICDGFAEIYYQHNATVFLDHPGNTANVGGVNTGFGKGMLITIQNTKLLNHHRIQLLKTNYYANWSDDDKRELCE